MYGGLGTDVLNGGIGPDKLYALAKDGVVDTLDCGPGPDVARIVSDDTVKDTTVHCEKVIEVAGTTDEPGESEADPDA